MGEHTGVNALRKHPPKGSKAAVWIFPNDLNKKAFSEELEFHGNREVSINLSRLIKGKGFSIAGRSSDGVTPFAMTVVQHL